MKLKKSKDKVFFGVCGGVAERFNFDPTIVRIAWAGATVFFGVGLFTYLVAALVMPSAE